MHLTMERIRKLEYDPQGPAQQIHWDDERRGLGVRVYPTGRKSYVLSYRNAQKRSRIMAMGSPDHLGLKDARQKAGKLLSDIQDEDKRRDPLEERRARSVTVAELCDEWLERKAGKRKTAYDYRRRIEKHIKPRWGKRSAVSIALEDVEELHATLGATSPYEANRVVRLISTLWNFGRDPRVRLLAKTTDNPAEGIELHEERSRDRWVNPDEIKAIAAALEGESPHIRGLFWLYLLTGCRKNELLRATWADIDRHARQLVLRDTKNGRTHFVPLTEMALGIIHDLPRYEGNPHLFPGKVPGQPLNNVSKAWNRIREAAGVPDVRLHDLRRTVGSWLAQSGKSLHLIGRVLNHADPRTTERYARFGEDHIRAALDEHSRRLLEATK